ncbi:MAG TPA: hypothetical protein PL151_11020 [Phycisphaerae bacterium]|nr:hypothetical protein [Phycisphaerae bacterium]HON67181.1 hypothetical protein [Phycisphaerae bacterium]HPZ98355.1 hypothetical protein [Phycisphaerae bacterium]HQE28283.1 hypothetical protein [Phycisphaerae bacterium]
MAKQTSSLKARRVGMSERTRNIVLASAGGITLLLGSYWAYMTFTTVPPPPLETSAPSKVVDFLGDPRGYQRMSHEAREQYLAETLAKFSQGPARQELANAFARMSTREKQVFTDATIETAKRRFLQQAEEYNRLPRDKQQKFVDNLIANFEASRRPLAGGGGQDNLGQAFKSMVPTTTDGMTKLLVEKTNSRQRAKAQPLFDAVAARYKEQQERKGMR